MPDTALADGDRSAPRPSDDAVGITAITINVIGLLAVLYLYVAVVPKFERMFNSLGGKLPTVTAEVLTLSRFLAGNLFIVLPLYAVAAILCFRTSGQARLVVGIIAIVHGGVLILLAWVAPFAIFYPILELQKTLS